MKGQQILEAIKRETSAGNKVNIWTELTCTPVTAKTFKRFENAGSDLFKVDGNGSLYIRSGKRWDCIDFCRFTVEYK